MTLGIITCAALPELARGDRSLRDLFASRGLPAKPLVWNDPRVDWARFAQLLVRTPWDYTEHTPAFIDWIGQRQQGGCQLLNPPAMLRWNLDKHYLRQMQQHGVATVPTLFLDSFEDATRLMQGALPWAGTARVVIKPVVSASARGTWLADWPLDAAGRDRLIAQCHIEAMMLQPFVETIETEGEWSVMVFGGQFSHAVLKKPEDGDFRVQSEHGGSTHALPPATGLAAASVAAVCAAEAILNEPCCYARVDWVRHGGSWALMELELIEPELFLGSAPGADERLVEAVLSAVRGL